MSQSHTASDRTPFTYLIGWRKLDKWYYGVRYAKNCHPSDLMQTYFTSSINVKKFIETNGMPDVIQVRKIFCDKTSAINWENKTIMRMAMVEDDRFLNRCHSKSVHPDDARKHLAGKTYEEAYGIEKAKELKAIRSLANKTRVIRPWEERRKGRVHKNKGRKQNSERTARMVESRNKTTMNINWKIEYSQRRGTHVCLLNECVCGMLKHVKRKFCCAQCAADSRKINLPYLLR
jgi:hypothetical protein